MYFNKVEIKATGSVNSKWRELHETGSLTLTPVSIAKGSSFYCIGSCFAEYVRTSIERETGRDSFPAYRELNLDYENDLVDTINIGKYHMNYYSSSSILQEFQRSWLGENNYPPIEVQDLRISEGKKFKKLGSVCYQDPYRREVFSNSGERISSLSAEISACVREGLRAANVFVITLGLVEIFKSESTGLVFNQFPGYQGAGYSSADLVFKRQTASEVEGDLRQIIQLLKSINRNNQIVFSVSPVPLQMTFTSDDVFIANMYSKSTLRSAVQHVLDPRNGVHYFPSFEIAMNLGSKFFQKRDMRHAKQEYVDLIVKTFLRSLHD